MVPVGKEVSPDDGVHPEGALVDEGFLRGELVKEALEVSVSDSPDPISNSPLSLVIPDVVVVLTP